MSESYSSHIEGVVDEPQAALGSLLRQARADAGLELDQISARLNISMRHLQALEQDDFQQLPNAAFARGYLRSYAKLLDLDGDVLVQRFNERIASEVERPVVTINKVRPQASMAHPLVKGVGLVLFVAFFGLSIWWWKAQTEPAISPDPAPVAGLAAPVTEPLTEAQSESLLTSPRLVSPDSPVMPSSADQATAVAEPSAEAPPAEEPPSDLTEEEIARLAAELERNAAVSDDAEPEQSQSVAAEPQPAEPMALTLELRVNQACWVTLKSAEGKTLVARTLQPGSELSIEVAPGAELLIGKVDAVSLAEYAGQALPLAEQARRNVARLTLSSPN